MKKLLKWLLLTVVVIFLLLQFTNPARTNPPVPPGGDIAATNPPPPQILALFHAACYDCHSYETTWPLYARIAPASWLVVSDVNHARERLNFSDWPHDQPDRAARRLESISEELGYREMPPADYTLMHSAARLTDAQRKELEDWADATAKQLKAAASKTTDDKS